MAQTRDRIEAPQVSSPRYGLVFAASTPNPVGFNFGAGFTFEAELCGVSGRVSIECEGNAGDEMDPTQGGHRVDGDPFFVWAGDKCSPYPGHDFEGRARRQLEATQSYQVANELWTGDLRDSDGLDNVALVDLTSDRLTTSAVDPVVALGMVDYALGRCSQGQRGMVHVTEQVLVHLAAATAIELNGGVWLTPNGNLVIADAGYDGSKPGGAAADTSQFIYGTGMLTVMLGTVEVIGDSVNQLDRTVNTRSLIVGRPVAIVWDECCHVAAEVNVAVPAIGGAS